MVIEALLHRSTFFVVHVSFLPSTFFVLRGARLLRGESSKGWLLRVLEGRPNIFSLLTPLLLENIGCSSEIISKELNLLNNRKSEICKCYQFDFVNVKGSINKIGSVNELGVIIRKEGIDGLVFMKLTFVIRALGMRIRTRRGSKVHST